jgi:mono/diheme cytochrome c family protein
MSANEKAWIAFIAACVLSVAAASVWRGSAVPLSPPGRERPSLPPPTLDPGAIPLVTGEESIQEQFIRAGCPVCHTIPGIAGALGRVGPPLVLGMTGPARLADSGYAGRAKTVREYIVESIVAPQDYVVPGYPERTMPAWYGSKLSAAALDQMAAYLEGITEEGSRQ